MFSQLFYFELQKRLNRLSALVYFVLFFGFSFLLGVTFGGAFKGATFNFGFSDKLALNSPVVLTYLTGLMGYFSLLIAAPIFGQSISQDFETHFHQVLFSTPISKKNYFFVRYLSALVATLIILSSIGLGIWFATKMPFVDKTLISKNHLWFYVAPYLTNLIPNLLVFGAIFIAVVSIAKKMAPVYVMSIAIVIGCLIAPILTNDLDNKLVAALIEPFGLEGVSQVIRYWSVTEQSTRVIPITGNFLYNRLLWGAIGGVFLSFAYLIFNPFTISRERKKETPLQTVKDDSSLFLTLKSIQLILRPYSLKLLWPLTFAEFKQAFSNMYFLLILIFGLCYIFAVSNQVGKIYGTETLPVTYQLLEVIGGSFSLFIVLLTVYYAGELVWKERDKNIYEIIHSKPISDVCFYLSKLFSLLLIQFFLLCTLLICCLLIQIVKGYFQFEWTVYFKGLFFYEFIPLILLGVFALFVQTIVSSKYVGHFVVILYFVMMILLRSLGLDHHLYLMGVPIRPMQYSAMNHYGSSWTGFLVSSCYWGVFYVCLAVISLLFWQRGMQESWTSRLNGFKKRFHKKYKIIISISLIIWILLGAVIFYNTNILNVYLMRATEEKKLADYERKYKHYQKMAMPELDAVNVNIDFYPEKQSMKVKGHFTYKNNSDKAIKTIFVNVKPFSHTILTWDKLVNLAKIDENLGVRIFALKEPLLPNNHLKLDFNLEIKPRGFKNRGFSTKILENGSFFYNTDYLPIMGYFNELELADEKSRRKYHLPNRTPVPSINDKAALNKTYFSQEGSWINFEATLSTAKDQIAIAPGYLVREWQQENRRFFQYKMDRPILNYYAFLSARYALLRDHWKNVAIEIYYHPDHTYNLNTMVEAIKRSLAYYTTNFSPYQFNQIRIVEFPKYVSLAQSFPNTIPYSEGLGFIAKVNAKDPQSIDYPFYVTAHEVSHQWWGHQVIGGNVQGATMLSESLAQYSALMVMEKYYGGAQMKKFLKYELDHYLNGRSHEIKAEQPVMFNESQPYIHYHKGGLVLYALKDYLGEKRVNQILRDFIRDFAFQKPPFVRSIDLVSRFKEALPQDQKYLIEDMFENITLYNNRIQSVTYSQMTNGNFIVNIETINKKLRCDALGRERAVSMNDYIDVGVFDKLNHLIYLKKHKMTSGKNVFSITVAKEPGKAGIDPFNKLIDKIPEDKVEDAVLSSS